MMMHHLALRRDGLVHQISVLGRSLEAQLYRFDDSAAAAADDAGSSSNAHKSKTFLRQL